MTKEQKIFGYVSLENPNTIAKVFLTLSEKKQDIFRKYQADFLNYQTELQELKNIAIKNF